MCLGGLSAFIRVKLKDSSVSFLDTHLWRLWTFLSHVCGEVLEQPFKGKAWPQEGRGQG